MTVGEDIKEIEEKILMRMMMMRRRMKMTMMMMRRRMTMMMMTMMTPGVLGAKVLRLIDDLTPGYNMLPPVGHQRYDDDDLDDNLDQPNTKESSDPPTIICIVLVTFS